MTPAQEIKQLEQIAIAQIPEVTASLEQAWNNVLNMPYKFFASDGRHVSWKEAKQRGYAACGEAAAYLAAVALKTGQKVKIVIEGTNNFLACGPDYRHAVVVVNGKRLNPYAKQACSAKPKVIKESKMKMQGNYVHVDRESGYEVAGLGASGAWIESPQRIQADFNKLVSKICDLPGFPQILQAHKELLKLVPRSKVNTMLFQVAGAMRNVPFAKGIPRNSEITKVWTVVDGFLNMCEGRSRGLDTGSMKALATAIEVINEHSGWFHAVGLAGSGGGAGGLVTGVATTALAGLGVPVALISKIIMWTGIVVEGVTISTNTAAAFGAPAELRKMATAMEAERMAPQANSGGSTKGRSVNYGFSTQSLLNLKNSGKSAMPASTSSAGNNTAMYVVGGLGLLGLAALVLKKRS